MPKALPRQAPFSLLRGARAHLPSHRGRAQIRPSASRMEWRCSVCPPNPTSAATLWARLRGHSESRPTIWGAYP
eukprot:10515802-Alexandrium_andersonii.AAC.1